MTETPSKKEVSTSELKRRTRRSFIVGALSFVFGFFGLKWIFSRREDDGVPWPLRRFFQINEGVSRDFFRPKHQAPEFSRVVDRDPRVNGDIGLNNEALANPKNWKLTVTTPSEDQPNSVMNLSLADVLALPRVETTFDFKCIEGWSETMTCAGARFSDFMARYKLGAKDATEYFPYVGLQTPDGKYYVSIDMESMLHAQTLLCYEMNGKPLSFDNGAPLRLIIPVKYGIKNLKQIGSIQFADSRPPDYWAERGYDWYSGL
jgi:DMSO/TMAO reductase YedYZ molybdopterin-dependent catalytic subunit